MSLKRKLKPSPAAAVAIVIIFTLLGWTFWQLLIPHIYESPGPSTLSEAKSHSPIPLPASARNIQIATYSHWIQFARYVRFEAPLADCEAHARILLPGTAPTKLGASSAASFAQPFNPGFRDVSPFDVRNISNGEMFGSGSPGEAHICIDIDRGLFYYFQTD